MKRIFLPVLLIAIFSSCSVFKETSAYEEVDQTNKESADEVYVFDEVSDTENNDNTTEIKELKNEVDNTLDENKNDANTTVTETHQTVVETVNEPVTTQDNNAYVETETETTQETYTTYSSDNGVYYYVQLGAFSTLGRAENFSSQITSEVPFELVVTYNNSNGLYVVRSTPYSIRSEAESIRDELKRNYKFRDSFIVTE